jgi:hypothetical protein
MLSRHDWPPVLVRLVRDFQHFCKIYPDLLGREYGGGNESIAELHFGLLPGLLLDIREWAQHEGDSELVAKAEQRRRDYAEYLAELTAPE